MREAPARCREQFLQIARRDSLDRRHPRQAEVRIREHPLDGLLHPVQLGPAERLGAVQLADVVGQAGEQELGHSQLHRPELIAVQPFQRVGDGAQQTGKHVVQSCARRQATNSQGAGRGQPVIQRDPGCGDEQQAKSGLEAELGGDAGRTEDDVTGLDRDFGLAVVERSGAFEQDRQPDRRRLVGVAPFDRLGAGADQRQLEAHQRDQGNDRGARVVILGRRVDRQAQAHHRFAPRPAPLPGRVLVGAETPGLHASPEGSPWAGKIDRGARTCTPWRPSTTCVTAKSAATLIKE